MHLKLPNMTTAQITANAASGSVLQGSMMYAYDSNTIYLATNTTFVKTLGGTPLEKPYQNVVTGEVVFVDGYITNTANFLPCDGRWVSANVNSNLFASSSWAFPPRFTPDGATGAPVLVPGVTTPNVRSVAWSANGSYLAVAHSADTGNVSITLAQYPNTVANGEVALLGVTLPSAANGNWVGWSPSERYLAAGYDVSPFLQILDFSNNRPASNGVATPLANVATLPAGAVTGGAWSPDGRYLAVAHTTTPFVSIYDWSQGSPPVKIANPASLPAGNATGVSWSANGRYMSVSHTTTPFVTIYDWSTGAPVKITNPTAIPTANASCTSFSPDGNYLAVGYNAAPYFSIYSFANGTPVKVANASFAPTGNVTSISWHPLGGSLYVGHTISPFMSFYTLYAGSATFGTTPATVPVGNVQSLAFSPNGMLVVIGATGAANTLATYVNGNVPSSFSYSFQLPNIKNTAGRAKAYIKT